LCSCAKYHTFASTMKKEQIAILMATYNGEDYLRPQLDSLFAQTCQEWHLYVHDDGSKDSTLSVIREYIERHPDRITLLDYPSQGGACKNFLSLLERVEAPYYMFCDQDDVWHPEKIAVSMEAMSLTEQQRGAVPVIVHSDLQIIDDNGNLLYPSFFKFSNIKPENIRCYEEYMQNVVTGSTMLFNHLSKEAALSRSYSSATMHDAWITLRTVAEGGVRHTLYTPMTDYRQHAGNVLGAQDGHRFTLLYRISHAREMLLMNYAHYKMLHEAGDMNFLSFLKNKFKSFAKNR